MRFVSRGIFVWSLALALIPAPSRAGRVRFFGAPLVEDQKISWTWKPLSPGEDTLGVDPYYQGNTIIESNGTFPGPMPGTTFRILRESQDGKRLYGVPTGADSIIVWDAATGAIQTTLGPPTAHLLDLDVHASDQLVLGGLDDGHVAFWDLRSGTRPLVLPGQRTACRFVRFLTSTKDPGDQRCLTAGTELDSSGATLGIARIWTQPGVLHTPSVLTPGNRIEGLALTENASLLALGDASGTIRVFQPLEPHGGVFNVVQLLRGHSGAVRSIVFSSDNRTMASADTTGLLIGWSAVSWASRFQVQATNATEVPRLDVRDPDGSLIYTLDSQGTLQIYDGIDGRQYRTRDLLNGAAYTAAAFGLSGREVRLALSDGTTLSWRVGFCQASQEDPLCFGGYKIWRSPTPRPEDAVELRRFTFGDSTWSFTGPDRSFTDPDSVWPRGAHHEIIAAGPHDGVPYYYSVTTFACKYAAGSISCEVGDTPAAILAGFYRADSLGPPTPVAAQAGPRTDRPLLKSIVVIPSPYEEGQDPQWGQKIEFRNLPSRALIRVYTVAGDLMRTIEHGPDKPQMCPGEPAVSDVRCWDLRNTHGEQVTSGIYIYHITTPLSPEQATGYFVLVR